MIIARLNGGLGNQMFQYALARALALKQRTQVLFDLSDLLDPRLRTLHAPRDFALGSFMLPKAFVDQKILNTFKPSRNEWVRLVRFFSPRTILSEKSLAFDPSINNQARRHTLLIGYWQSERYFSNIRETLLRDFELLPPLQNTARTLMRASENRNSVSVHVRRGDYASKPAVTAYHGQCGPAYYESAIRLLFNRVQDPLFVVFSDDVEWCRSNLKFPADTLFMEPGRPPALDMVLMSWCRHHIIANSSFSWWGAWLNPSPDKIVMAPRPWISSSAPVQPDIYPAQWTTISIG